MEPERKEKFRMQEKKKTSVGFRLFRVSFVLDDPYHFYLLPSFFFLILELFRLFYREYSHHSFRVTFYPRFSPFSEKGFGLSTSNSTSNSTTQVFSTFKTVVGIYVDETTPSSDGFCVVNEIHRGGVVDISGYDQMNGEILRVQVGDWLLRINDISCKYVPR